METRQGIGFVFGFVFFSIWMGISLQLIFIPANESMLVGLIQSFFESLFKLSAATSQYFALTFSAFNCFACLVWMSENYITNAKNKSWFMLLMTIWMTLNLCFFTYFFLNNILYHGIGVMPIIYLYGFVLAVFGIGLFALNIESHISNIDSHISYNKSYIKLKSSNRTE